MKTFLILLLSLATAAADVRLTNIVSGSVGDYSLNPQKRVNLTVTLLYPNPRLVNNFLVRQDAVATTTDTNGFFAFTNLQWGIYALNVQGLSGTGFKFIVGTNTSGSVPLSALVTNAAALPPNPATNYYTQAQVDALLANGSGAFPGYALTNNNPVTTPYAVALTNSTLNGMPLLSAGTNPASAFDAAGSASAVQVSVNVLATNTPTLRKVSSPSFTGWAIQQTNGPTHPGPNQLGLLDPYFLDAHTNLAASIDIFGVFNFYQNPVRVSDSATFLTTADLGSGSPLAPVDGSGLTGIYSNNITGKVNLGQLDPPLGAANAIPVTLQYITNTLFDWNTNVAFCAVAGDIPVLGKWVRKGGTTTFTNASGDGMVYITSGSLSLSNSSSEEDYDLASPGTVITNDWQNGDGSDPNPIFIYGTNSLSFALGAVTNINLGNGLTVCLNGSGVTNVNVTQLTGNKVVTNFETSVTLNGITITASPAFGANADTYGINDTGAIVGVDTFGHNLRIKQNSGGEINHMDKDNGVPFWWEREHNGLNMIVIPPNGKFGDVVGFTPGGRYPTGAGGEMYVPHYTGSGAGLADLPDPVGVSSALPVPSVAFTTFYLYNTNVSELVVTNLARMISTNGMLPHMTNYGIPVVVHLDVGWQGTNRDAAGNLTVRSGQFPNGMKQTANECHSFLVGLRPTLLFDTFIPTNGNTLHVGANGGSPMPYPQKPDAQGAGIIVDCSNPNTVNPDVVWLYTNNCDQLRVADSGNNFGLPGYQSQSRLMWAYAAQNPAGANWRTLANRGVSNCLAMEWLGTEVTMPPFILRLSNMQGTDVIPVGTNFTDEILGQLRRYDSAQFMSFAQGSVPELSYDEQVFNADTNSFKAFQTLAAVVPCSEIMTSRVITNGYAAWMTNESVWSDFAAPFKTRVIGHPVLTNGVSGDFVTWCRQLDNGEMVVGVLNKSSTSNSVSIPFTACGLNATDPYLVYDDWGQTNYGVFTTSFTASVIAGSGNLYHISHRGAGLASYATVTVLAVTGGGITNTSGVNIIAEGFTGVSVTQYDSQTNSTSRGTISTVTDIILQPNGRLVGSSCAASGVHPL